MSNAVKGREVAVASCNCETKLRKVKEWFVRLVVSKYRLLTVVHILRLLPGQVLAVTALLPPKPLVSPESSGHSPALVYPVHKPVALSCLLFFQFPAALAVGSVAMHAGAKHHMLEKVD